MMMVEEQKIDDLIFEIVSINHTHTRTQIKEKVQKKLLYDFRKITNISVTDRIEKLINEGKLISKKVQTEIDVISK